MAAGSRLPALREKRERRIASAAIEIATRYDPDAHRVEEVIRRSGSSS